MMRRKALLAVIWVSVAGFGSGVAVRAAADGDELETHLAAQRKQMEDPRRSQNERGRIALEMAATLDRAAGAAGTADARRARWVQAVTVLDEFNAKEPRNSHKDEIAFQAAVYLWAQAQSFAQQVELSPRDRAAKARAVELFDASIERLRAAGRTAIVSAEALDQNRRFRLSQAIADRARLTDDNPDARRAAEEEALGLLEGAFADPALNGFAHLLKAELLGRLGRFDKAQAEVKAAAKLKPPPPAATLAEAQLTVAIGQKKFEEAIKAIDKAPIDDAERGLLAIRCRLAERADLPEGNLRAAAEADAFRRAEALRGSGKVEARMALMTLARAIETPETSQMPEAWDLLAEGCLGLGDAERASGLEAEGASRAEAEGRKELAASLRNRAGAMLFQAGQYARANAFLTKVFYDPQAGDIRPKAGMLRILALGRGVAQRQPGCTRESYIDAIREQLREFPNDPSAGEARWLLGKVRLSAGDREQATELWKAIPVSHARWLDAHLAVAQMMQEALENQLIDGDLAEARQRMNEAVKFLTESRSEARDPNAQAELGLRRARLELTPGVGHPETARSVCDSLLTGANQVELRDRARRLRIAAMAELGLFVDAERDARAEVNSASPADLLDLARILDRAASANESDLIRRRLGQIMRILMTRVRERNDDLPPARRDEARLRETRALLFTGSYDPARRALSAWSVPADTLTDDLLDDLADTYVRLDAFPIAIDVFRLRAQHARPGSLAWFGARYGLALSYYRSGKLEEARRLIDATAILHPDLGGGSLKGKFEHLRQRLAHE